MENLSGKTLGRYRLEALLGRGGMAEVWRARDTKLERTVAVKVILASFADDEQFLSRFHQEARLVASLEHPNVLPIYDFGEEADLPFLVMPYLDGGTLRDRMRGEPVPFPLAASWIRQLGDALDAAHAAGILHRDVKPANVLLGKGDRLALADFGIARMLESITRLTATGMVVGTPVYMSPEQAQGRPASPASDRYALAVIAFELLTGKPPFDGESALSLMHQHVTSPVPSAVASNAALPAGVDGVFLRALSKDADERPLSGRALAEELATMLGTGIPAPLEAPTARWPAPGEASGAGRETTVLESLPKPTPIPATPRPGSPLLSSEATVTAREPASAAGWGKVLTTTAAIVVVFGGIGIVSLRNRGKEPTSLVPPRTQQRAAVPTPSAPASPAAAPTPAPETVVVVERAVPPTPRPPRLDFLVTAFEKAVAESRLSPPAERNALDAMADLRREFPDAREVSTCERRLVKALAAELESRGKGPGVGGASSRAAEIPAVPPAQEPPAPRRSPSDERAELAAARARLDPAAKANHRLEKRDFEAALATARASLAKRPGNPESVAMSLYAQGGLEYLAGNDVAAGRLLVGARRENVARGSASGVRDLPGLLGRLSMLNAAPTGWELALLYGDARGEAERLIAKDVFERPGDVRALMGRAILHHIRGEADAALSDATTAWKRKGSAPGGPGIALFAGEECERLGRWEDAFRWYGEVSRGKGAVAAQGALRGGKVARDHLGKKDEAAELLRAGCAGGSAEACREVGESPTPAAGPRRRLPRR